MFYHVINFFQRYPFAFIFIAKWTYLLLRARYEIYKAEWHGQNDTETKVVTYVLEKTHAVDELIRDISEVVIFCQDKNESPEIIANKIANLPLITKYAEEAIAKFKTSEREIVTVQDVKNALIKIYSKEFEPDIRYEKSKHSG